MNEQPKIATERLLDVIQVIQFSHQTGVLAVERGGAPHPEQGIIIFLKGKQINAFAGVMQGTDAIRYLHGWKACRFKFTHKAEKDIPSVLQELEQRDTGPQQKLITTSGEIPAISIGRKSQPITSPGNTSLTNTGPIQKVPRRTPHNEQQAMAILSQFQQSRALKHLYLLIDGQRTPIELARITGRRIDEIYMAFQELMRAGLITF